jgi:transporter family protein
MSPIIYGLFGMVGIGVLNILISLLNRNNDSFKIGFLIQLGNSLVTLALFPILYKENPGSTVFFSLIIAGISGALAFVFINKAFKEGKASINSPIISTWGMITAIFGFILLNEDFYLSKGISMLLIVLGIFLSSIDIKTLLKSRSLKLIGGVKWSILAALNLGISFFTITYFAADNHWYTVSLFTRFWTIITYLVLAGATHKPVLSYFKNLPLLLFFAIFVDVVSFLMMSIGYTTSEPGVVSVITSASPALTIILSFLILKEKITKQQLFGVVVVIAGIILLALN